jgi:predicted nucleic acid-binding protein
VRLDFGIEDHRPDVFRLLRKYADQQMSVADACLVRMAELAEASQVFTTDPDFLGYRRKGRQRLPLLAPFPTT